MPDKIHAWESEKYTARAKAEFISFLFDRLPHGDIDTDNYNILLRRANDTVGENQERTAERQEELNRFIELDDENFLRFPAWHIPIQGVTDQLGVVAMNNLSKSFATLLNSESQRRTDPRIKTLYSDYAFLVDSENGNFVQMQAESTYLSGLIRADVSFVNPKSFSSAEQKAALGVPLYEAIYDFRHAVVGEARVEYHKQKLDKEGWTPENTDIYMKELLAAHNETLKQYTKLSSFYETPGKIENEVLGDSLTDILGRSQQSPREINRYVGIIRGERQAIENGWGKDELFILGTIGYLEECIQKEEKYGTQNVKESMSEYKSAFIKLKEECYFTRVDSGEQKAKIATKIQEFIQKYSANEASPAARACTSHLVKNYKTKFNQAVEAVNESVEKERQNGVTEEDKILSDPAGYFQRLVEDAKASGDYRRAVLEYMYLEEKVINKIPDENDPRRTAFFTVADAFKDRTNPDVIKICDAMFDIFSERALEYSQVVEQLAADIRAGRQKIDGKYDNIKTNYRFSIKYANRLLKDTPFNKRQVDILNLYNGQAMAADDYYTDIKKYLRSRFDNFVENATDSYSYTERILRSKRQALYSNLLFGDDDNSIVKALRDDEKKLHKYEKQVNEGADQAKKHFNELKTLAAAKKTAIRNELGEIVDARHPEVKIKLSDANSQAFMNMYNALEKVSKLSVENASPKELCEAYHNLHVTSKAYEDKINSQTFAGISTNGKKRKTLSQDLQKFAMEQLLILVEVPANIDLDRTIEVQKNELKEMTQSQKDRLKPTMKEKITEKINSYKEKNIVWFDPEKSLEINKSALIKSLAGLIILVNYDIALNAEPGRLLCEADLSDASISEGANNLMRKNPQFDAMANDINSLEDYNNIYQMAKDNPKVLMEHLNKYAPKAPEKKASNNIIVGPEVANSVKAGPRKGM